MPTNKLSSFAQPKAIHPPKKSISDRVILLLREYSWTIAFVLLCSVGLEFSLKAKEEEHLRLQNERISLESQLQLAQLQHLDLLKELSSHDDPEWIKLVMMKKLGLVPEGQKKILFSFKKD
ncbi:MAG: hypothetical protein ACSNEK_06495 [Parachlamydiaceae bacterium]